MCRFKYVCWLLVSCLELRPASLEPTPVLELPPKVHRRLVIRSRSTELRMVSPYGIVCSPPPSVPFTCWPTDQVVPSLPIPLMINHFSLIPSIFHSVLANTMYNNFSGLVAAWIDLAASFTLIKIYVNIILELYYTCSKSKTTQV